VKYRAIVDSLLQLSRDGKSSEVLRILDQFLRDADPASDSVDFVLAVQHAGVTAEHLGDLQLAESYYQQGLKASPADPLLLLGIWSIRKRLGDVAGARAYFGECRRASLAQANEEVFATLKELEARDGDLG